MFGSYLAACIFYNIIFETTSTGNGYLPAGVSPTEATYLQDVADHVVYDVDSITVDYTINPVANFNNIVNQPSVVKSMLRFFSYWFVFSSATVVCQLLLKLVC